VIRIIVRVDRANPDGSTLAPVYRTVLIESRELEEALKPPGTYCDCAVVGAETVSVTRGTGD
jgi:hypothetical protein